MKTKLFITLMLLLSVGYLKAQVATIPFELYDNNTIFVKLPLHENGDSLLFLFDTGASASLIDSTRAAQLGLKSNYEQKVAGASGSKSYFLILNQTLMVDKKTKIEKVTFVIDNISRLQSNVGRNFDGIIGYSMLSAYKTRIDFDTRKIELYAFTDPVETTGYSKLNFTFNNNIPIPQVPVTIELNDGSKFSGDVFFDSGAALTLLVNTPFKETNNLVQKVGKTIKSESNNLSSTTILERALIKSLQVGDYKFGESTIVLSSDKAGVSALPNYLGIWGSEYIYRFNFILDYSKKELYLKPNHLFNSKFRFPLTGFNLISVNNEIVISSIDPSTEAYKQGLREGQKILSINGKSSSDLSVVREMLAEENAKVTIKYQKPDKSIAKAKFRLKRLI